MVHVHVHVSVLSRPAFLAEGVAAGEIVQRNMKNPIDFVLRCNEWWPITQRADNGDDVTGTHNGENVVEFADEIHFV